MADVKIPKQFKNKFINSVDKALELESFTVKELAEATKDSEMIASIMIGFMDKAGVTLKSDKNALKTLRLTKEEWEAIGKDINLYNPIIEEEAAKEDEINQLESEKQSIEFKPAKFKKHKLLFTEDGKMHIKDKNSILVFDLSDMSCIFERPATFWKPGFVYFSESGDFDKASKLSPFFLTYSKSSQAEIDELLTVLSDHILTRCL